MRTPAELLELVDQLRARGARMVRVHGDGGVEAIFDGPPTKPETERDVAAEVEAAKRREAARERSLDDRLLKPLGIKKGKAA